MLFVVASDPRVTTRDVRIYQEKVIRPGFSAIGSSK